MVSACNGMGGRMVSASVQPAMGWSDGISKRAACNGMVGRYQQACSLQWDGRMVTASVNTATRRTDGISKPVACNGMGRIL
jgi:hypothetical protein